MVVVAANQNFTTATGGDGRRPCSGMFVCGPHPLWLVASRGALVPHPMDVHGAVAAFTPFNSSDCPQVCGKQGHREPMLQWLGQCMTARTADWPDAQKMRWQISRLSSAVHQRVARPSKGCTASTVCMPPFNKVVTF